MKAGDTLRFRGPAGAEFVVTVGAPFDERTIRARIDSGEWTPLEEKTPEPEPPKRAARKTAAKKTAARKDTSTSDEGDGHGG
ncbi:hypothetical protein ACPCTG_26450 [Streptomyces pseudogriseolus]|uniref:hypothetical protein n=1 Tax=Streptomyces pseudogriseolus TaxID=36817 RepID=UPI003FA33AFF